MVGSLIRAYYAAFFGMVSWATFGAYPLNVPAPQLWPWLFMLCSMLALVSLVTPTRTAVAWALAVPAGLGVCRAIALLGATNLTWDQRLVGAGMWLFPLILALDSEAV